MILGVTGCPGSGKSLLAKLIAEKGFLRVDADKVGRDLVENDAEILKELRISFGDEILRADGTLDRRVLAEMVFESKNSTSLLNNLVHPKLKNIIRNRTEEMVSANKDGVVDCALIYEWGIESLFDLRVCVAADIVLRRERLRERDGRSLDEIEGMFRSQISEEEKIRRSDITLTNNGSQDMLSVYASMLCELSGKLYT